MAKQFKCIMMDVVTQSSLFSGGDGIEVISTNSDVIDWITEQIKNLVPKVKVENRPNLSPFMKGCGRKFSKLKNNDYSVAWWIIQQLCLEGWEPYGKTVYSRSNGCSSITLRLEMNN